MPMTTIVLKTMSRQAASGKKVCLLFSSSLRIFADKFLDRQVPPLPAVRKCHYEDQPHVQTYGCDQDGRKEKHMVSEEVAERGAADFCSGDKHFLPTSCQTPAREGPVEHRLQQSRRSFGPSVRSVL